MDTQNDKHPFSANSSLNKAFAILEFLAQKNTGQSVPNISRLLKFNKTTTYNILRTLEYLNYVVKYSDGSYGLTSKLLELGSKPLKKKATKREYLPIPEGCEASSVPQQRRVLQPREIG